MVTVHTPTAEKEHARNCNLAAVTPITTPLTLLALAGNAPTALRWGWRTAAGDLHDFGVAEALLLRLLPQPGPGRHEQGPEHEQHPHAHPQGRKQVENGQMCKGARQVIATLYDQGTKAS